MKIKVQFVLKILLLTIIFFNESFSQGFLRADGKNIINDVNSNYLLKSMGLGGWLVQEGYMLQTGALDAEHQIRQGIIDLVGEARAEELYNIYYNNYVNEIDIDSLAGWGFNSIRLPIHWNKLISTVDPLTFNEEGFKKIDTLLTWCKKNKLYLILDLHAAPGGQSKGGIADYDPSIPYLWDSELMKLTTIKLWKKMAQRYANEEWIGGYDLINEPAEDLGTNAPALRDLYTRITDSIRAVDVNHIIFIEGNWWATTFDGLTPPWDNNMVYSFHKYWNETDLGTINYLIGIRNANNVPLWLGETGENSNEWFRENVKLMEDNNIGWAWWPHKKIESVSCPLSVPMVEGYSQLINYWNGAGSKPNSDYAFNVLKNQFNALKLENCKIQPEVYKSLFEPKPDISIPFTYHEIPGTIYGTDYDIGGQGVGYYDIDYKNTTGNAGNTANTGGQYRNDGVDIEQCLDFKRNGYNVGWISSTEWLKYTVNIIDSGYYNIEYRIASTTDKGIIVLDLDSKNLLNINLPNTGGWQTWQSVSSDSVYLPAGEHKLLVRFYLTGSNGSFNFNYLEFSKLATDVSSEEVIPKQYELFQNYPNPFNPTTRISYLLTEKGNVVLTFFNSLGQEVLSEKFLQNSGKHSYNFLANNLPSGIYYCRLNATSISSNSAFNKTIKMLLLK